MPLDLRGEQLALNFKCVPQSRKTTKTAKKENVPPPVRKRKRENGEPLKDEPPMKKRLPHEVLPLCERPRSNDKGKHGTIDNWVKPTGSTLQTRARSLRNERREKSGGSSGLPKTRSFDENGKSQTLNFKNYTRSTPGETKEGGDIIDLTDDGLGVDIDGARSSTSKCISKAALSHRLPSFAPHQVFPTPPPTVPQNQRLFVPRKGARISSSATGSSAIRPSSAIADSLISNNLPTPKTPMQRHIDHFNASRLEKKEVVPETPSKSSSAGSSQPNQNAVSSSSPSPLQRRANERESRAAGDGTINRLSSFMDVLKSLGSLDPNEDPFALSLTQAMVPSSQTFELPFPIPSPPSNSSASTPVQDSLLNAQSAFRFVGPNDTLTASANVMDMSRRPPTYGTLEVIPSSQTQELRLPGTPSLDSGLRGDLPICLTTNSTVTGINIDIDCSGGEIVPSSQTQTEKELHSMTQVDQPLYEKGTSGTTLSMAEPGGDLSRNVEHIGSHILQDKTFLTPRHIALVSEKYNETSDGTLVTNSDSQSLAQLYTSPLRPPSIRSNISTQSQDATHCTSTMPSPLRVFKHMFDDQPSWLQSQGPSSPGTSASNPSKDADIVLSHAIGSELVTQTGQKIIDRDGDSSDTEPESPDALDYFFQDLKQKQNLEPQVSFSEAFEPPFTVKDKVLPGDIVEQSTPSTSREKYYRSEPDVSPLRQSLPMPDEGYFGGGEPLSIPSGVVLNSSCPSGSSASMQSSAPSGIKDFMAMLEGDGSYPDDFPRSLR